MQSGQEFPDLMSNLQHPAGIYSVGAPGLQLDFNPDPSSSLPHPKPYNPKSGRGRRKISTEPVSVRQGQLRDAQRALRERKAAYVSGLEQKIKDLENEVAQLKMGISSSLASNSNHSEITPPPTTTTPNTIACEKCRSAAASNNVQMASNSDFHAPPQFGVQTGWSRPIVPPVPTSNNSSPMMDTESNSNEWMDVSNQWTPSLGFTGSIPATTTTTMNQNYFIPAIQLFGPAETEFGRITLKSLDSLQSPESIQLVDEFFDVCDRHALVSDRRDLKAVVFETVRLCTRILDTCGILDKQKVLETFSLLRERNKEQQLYLDKISMHKSFRPSSPTRLAHRKSFVASRRNNDSTNQRNVRSEKVFRSAIKAIKSLEGAEDIIDELCDTLYDCKLDGQHEQRFFKMLELSSTLQNMCTSMNDRTQFMLATEIGREGVPGWKELFVKKE